MFFDTKVLAHRLNIVLGLAGVKSAELHGNLAMTQRLEALDRRVLSMFLMVQVRHGNSLIDLYIVQRFSMGKGVSDRNFSRKNVLRCVC